MTNKRQKYPTRTVLLRSEAQRNQAIIILNGAPLDSSKPLEFVLREEVKQRKQSQNDLMWVRELKDISEQAYIEGRTYSVDVWHTYFKRLYLPENDNPELPALVNDLTKYRKWDYDPSGERILVGSTTDLSVRGFALYLQNVTLHGESMGVMFHTR